MNLLYIWNENYYLDSEEKGYLLNSKYNIQFYKAKMELHIDENDDYIEGFWGEHIFDAMAIVGKNGTGKTMLANCIMDTLFRLETIQTNKYGSDRYDSQFIVAFEDVIEGKKGIKIFVKGKLEGISVKSAIDYKLYTGHGYQEIEKFKFGYFKNVLDLIDYKNERYGVVFDASVGGSINKCFKHDLEMHYINTEKDKILNYYENEIMKVLDFINSVLDNTKIPFVLPKSVSITLVDYEVNLRYISRELDKMSERKSALSAFSEKPSNILNRTCQYIIKKYGKNWCSQLVVNLILNLFKELCIPQTSAEHLESEADAFLKGLINIDRFAEDDSLETMLRLFDYIKNDKNEHEIYLYRQFIYKLQEMGIRSEGGRRRFHNNSLILKLPEDTSVMKELLLHYKNTNFSYPYFSFDFGLSTGEFNFLKLFSNIAELTSKDSDGKLYVQNNITHKVKCENLFLYFDEVDLSLHPEWQQRYVDWILQFIDTYFKNCTVQIIITTHSPIMLSDFPKNNVLYLWKDAGRIHAERRDIKTFGNNIHTLFMDSFFLNEAGTMGAYAEKKINAIASGLKKGMILENKNVTKIIDNIGDDIIRNRLLQMYDSKMYVEKKSKQENPDEAVIDSTISLIKKQIRNLENTIDELESMKSDKDRIEHEPEKRH